MALAVLCAVQAVAARVHPSDDGVGGAAARPPSSAPTGAGATAGLVTTVVRLADPSASLLVHAGSVVDILAAPSDSGIPTSAVVDGTQPLATVVAAGAQVMAVPQLGDSVSGSVDGAVLVVAVTPTTARVLAVAAATARLSVVVRSGATVP